jgi:hypothetical protein
MNEYTNKIKLYDETVNKQHFVQTGIFWDVGLC